MVRGLRSYLYHSANSEEEASTETGGRGCSDRLDTSSAVQNILPGGRALGPALENNVRQETT